MQCIGIKGDVFHPAAANAPGKLIGTPEVPFEPPRATRTACTLAVLESRSAIWHNASRSMSLSSLTEATSQPSSRATGRPQPSGGSAYTGNAVSGASAAPPKSSINWRRLMRSFLVHTFCGRQMYQTILPTGLLTRKQASPRPTGWRGTEEGWLGTLPASDITLGAIPALGTITPTN